MAKVRGENIYLLVNIAAVYTKVGGQKDGTLGLSQDSRDVTDKDSAGWKERELGNRSVAVSFSSFIIEDNAAFLELRKGLINGAGAHQKCDIRVETPAKTYTGDFIMTSMDFGAPAEEMGDVSFSLENDGILTEVTK